LAEGNYFVSKYQVFADFLPEFKQGYF